MKFSIGLSQGAVIILAPLALAGCAQVGPGGASDEVVVLSEDPAAPRNSSTLDQESLSFGDLNVEQATDDPRCSVTLDQIEGGSTTGCPEYAVREPTGRIKDLDGEMPDGLEIETSLDGSLAPELRFSTMTGDALNPDAFDPKSELDRIGRTGSTRSLEALAIASEVLAQAGALTTPEGQQDSSTPDGGVTPQTPGVTTP